MKRCRGPREGLALILTAALALVARGAPAQTVQTIIGPSSEDGLPATPGMAARRSRRG
jgi:hypothetical protein